MRESDIRVKVSVMGLANNIFFRNIQFVHDLNLPTLRIREPDVYETVKPLNTRKALVLTGFFQASRFKGREEDLEIEMPNIYPMTHYDFYRFHRVVTDKGHWKFESTPMEEYRGEDSVKVTIKAISTLFNELTSPENPWPSHLANKLFKLAENDETAFNNIFEVVKRNLWKYKKRINMLLSIEL